MGKYINNLETGKIELHFEKSDYMNMTDAEKKELKSAYLFSGKLSAWVSRETRNHYRALQVAKKLGFDTEVRQGERISYAEELDRKAEKAEARAGRYERYSENAEKRAEGLQAALNSMRGDIAFFTQPIIAGHSGSQAFARCRQKMYARYDRGFEEYKKSAYYQDRAATARETANNAKLKDAVYLDTRIKECNKLLKAFQNRIVTIEENIYKIQQGEQLRKYSGEIATVEEQEKYMQDVLDKYEYQQDKLNFLEDCLQSLGGIQFSQENIKAGYVVELCRWGECEILSSGPINVQYKILTGGAKGMCGTEPYAAIKKIVAVKAVEKLVNPYKVGDIVCSQYMASGKVYKAFQVVKTTETGCKIQQIKVDGETPIKDAFISDKQEQKKVQKSRYSEWVGMYADDWQLHKYAV